MDRVQLPQDCKAITRRQSTFEHYVTRSSWYSFDWPRKDGKAGLSLEPLIGLEPEASRLGIRRQRLQH